MALLVKAGGKAFKPTQSKTVTPTAAGLTVTPDEGQSLGEVIINGDADLIAENIRQGIDIFGVIGAMSEGLDLLDILSAYGFTKIAVDENVYSGYTKIQDGKLIHSLGEIPKFFILLDSTINTSGSSAVMGSLISPLQQSDLTATTRACIAYYTYWSSGKMISVNAFSPNATVTENDITLTQSTTNIQFGAGLKYILITMA